MVVDRVGGQQNALVQERLLVDGHDVPSKVVLGVVLRADARLPVGGLPIAFARERLDGREEEGL